MALLEAVRTVNQTRPGEVMDLIERAIPSLAGASVAVLGLSFKPGTDDVRKSPAIPIIRGLLERGADVRATDPVAVPAAAEVLAGEEVVFSSELEQTIEDVDAIVVVTAWDEYRKLPLLLDDRRPQPLVVDGRRMFRPDEFDRYTGIGT